MSRLNRTHWIYEWSKEEKEEKEEGEGEGIEKKSKLLIVTKNYLNCPLIVNSMIL